MENWKIEDGKLAKGRIPGAPGININFPFTFFNFTWLTWKIGKGKWKIGKGKLKQGKWKIENGELKGAESGKIRQSRAK
jgi:hypothetical protein